MVNLMSFLNYLKNAATLLCQGKWREFLFRLRVYLVGVDLSNVSNDELNIPVERGHEYANSGGRHLEIVLETLKITPEDAVLDYGSGKGGALMTLAKFPFSRITGIELSPELVAVARKNLKGLNAGRITMIVDDAVNLTDLEAYNYFYFFNPFPAAVMIAVIKNIANSLTRKPRKAVIIYLNPEFHESVVTDSPFVKVDELHHHPLKYFIYSNDYNF
jgi:16S rRNA G966 N2-methylase RsmD